MTNEPLTLGQLIEALTVLKDGLGDDAKVQIGTRPGQRIEFNGFGDPLPVRDARHFYPPTFGTPPKPVALLIV